MAEILERIGTGLLKILNMFKNPELIKPIDDGAEIEPPIDEKKDFPQTLGELLENLDITFDHYKLKSFSTSWLHQKDRKGLKKLGAHVPNPWLFRTLADDEVAKVEVSKGMPAIMFVSLPQPNDDKNVAHLNYFYAIKHKKLPWNVEKKHGTPYQFGMAYSVGKLFWIHAWLVVHADGTFEICKERQDISIPVVKNGVYKGSYTKHIFDDPELVAGYKEENRDGQKIVNEAFMNVFNWWVKRDERWSVSVKKNHELVTFAVDKTLTKNYFADRNITARTPTGQKKKIFHYVKEHERNYKNKKTIVKEHLRGINAFEWNGYQCKISAPEFGMKISTSFTAGADDIDPNEKAITLDQVADRLVAHEERMATR